MTLYTFRAPHGLDRPVLIASFQGWVDAAEVGTTAASHLADGGDVVASFDGDELFDYRSSRPVVEFIDGHLRSLEWPKLEVIHRSIGHRQLLILHGTEPDLQWRRFVRSVGDLAEEAGVAEFVAIGSVPAAVPHTRQTPLMSTSPDPDLIDASLRTPGGLLMVPAAALTVLSQHLHTRGLPARGYWVQVPQYVTGPFHQGVIRLLEQLSSHLGVSIPLGSLLEDAVLQREHLDGIAAARPDVQKVVERLEELAEEGSALPSAEEIGSQVERFLREAAEGDESN
jgi:hypothetical protein